MDTDTTQEKRRALSFPVFIRASMPSPWTSDGASPETDWRALSADRQGPRAARARRNTDHGSGPGVDRYVVKQTLALLYQFRLLRARYDRRDDVRETFMALGCSMICWRRLGNGYC